MKPEPYLAPPPRKLTDDERLHLRASNAGGTPHAVRPRGSSGWALIRRLEKMGLGTVDERGFTVNARGVAASKP